MTAEKKTLTDTGRDELLWRLCDQARHEITDHARFFTVVAFLSLLPDRKQQHAVLRRRLEFLETPASFFYDGDRSLRAEEVADPTARHAPHRPHHEPRGTGLTPRGPGRWSGHHQSLAGGGRAVTGAMNRPGPTAPLRADGGHRPVRFT